MRWASPDGGDTHAFLQWAPPEGDGLDVAIGDGPVALFQHAPGHLQAGFGQGIAMMPPPPEGHGQWDGQGEQKETGERIQYRRPRQDNRRDRHKADEGTQGMPGRYGSQSGRVERGKPGQGDEGVDFRRSRKRGELLSP